MVTFRNIFPSPGKSANEDQFFIYNLIKFSNKIKTPNYVFLDIDILSTTYITSFAVC